MSRGSSKISDASTSVYAVEAYARIVVPENGIFGNLPGPWLSGLGELPRNPTLPAVHRKGDISQTENVAMTISRLAEKPPGGLPYLIVRPIP